MRSPIEWVLIGIVVAIVLVVAVRAYRSEEGFMPLDPAPSGAPAASIEYVRANREPDLSTPVSEQLARAKVGFDEQLILGENISLGSAYKGTIHDPDVVRACQDNVLDLCGSRRYQTLMQRHGNRALADLAASGVTVAYGESVLQ